MEFKGIVKQFPSEWCTARSAPIVRDHKALLGQDVGGVARPN